MKKVSLKNIQVIDVHCHPYYPSNFHMETDQFVRNLSLSVLPEMFKKHTIEKNHPYPRTNMFVQLMIQKLAKFFSCEPTLDEVLIHRNLQVPNFEQYVKSLFKEANISTVLLDYSYPTPQVSKDSFLPYDQITKFEIERIEPVMDRLRIQCLTFHDFVDSYRRELAELLKPSHVLGLKSIIAYRSGLEIGTMDQTSAEQEFEVFQKDHRAAVKSLRDYCLHIAMEECTKSNKVMHIHTGFGDGEVVLSKASPKFLLNFPTDPKYKDTKVHLVHGGYPWMEEAAFIVSILPNVYMDISLQIPFTGHGAERIISQVFELAPFDKVMYGSDAINLPEIYWLGVTIFKEAFEKVLNQWIENEYMSTETAETIGKMVLYQNFMDVYPEAFRGNDQ